MEFLEHEKVITRHEIAKNEKETTTLPKGLPEGMAFIILVKYYTIKDRFSDLPLMPMIE